jgi:hypothetical protein
VFGEARKRFAFDLRGFRFEEERLSFYVRPADGLQLPMVMQWLKQTFAVRFNLGTGRTGYVWEDRYWLRVLKEEPPEWVGEAVEVAAETGEISFGDCPPDGVRSLVAEPSAETEFSPPAPRPIPASSRLSTETRPKTLRNHRHKPPPKCHHATARERSVQSSTPAAFQKSKRQCPVGGQTPYVYS